jgi:ABC-type nitrate/sulfonate/bicarbonate transport system ATPase subunit
VPKVEDVTLQFAEKRILDHLSWQMPETGITCMTGPSGCGKTTLFRVLAGLQKPDSGRVLGVEKGQCAFLFQEDRLLPWRTAAENIQDVLSKHERQAALEWLSLVELKEEARTYPSELSGGMRRRVALARALAYCLERPGKLSEGGRFLLMDEPFSGLDGPLRSRLIKRICALNVPALVITHDLQEIQQMADWIVHWEGPPLRLVSCLKQEKKEKP